MAIQRRVRNFDQPPSPVVEVNPVSIEDMLAVYDELRVQGHSVASIEAVARNSYFFAEFEVVPEPVVAEATQDFAVGDLVIALGEYAKIVSIEDGGCIGVQFAATDQHTTNRRHDCDGKALPYQGRFVNVVDIVHI